MRNSAISTNRCQSGATSKTAEMLLIFLAQSLLVKCNKGSLVEQQVSRKLCPRVSLGHTYKHTPAVISHGRCLLFGLGQASKQQRVNFYRPGLLTTTNTTGLLVPPQTVFRCDTESSWRWMDGWIDRWMDGSRQSS